MQEDAAKRWDDSLISLGLGALVVVVSGILIYNYFSGQAPNLLKNTQRANASPSSAQVAQQPESSPANGAQNAPAQSGTLALPVTHTVAAGESLWKLAEKYYGTGYEWRRIAEANKLNATARLSTGMQLQIPRAELISATATEKSPEPTQIAQANATNTPAPTASATVAPTAVAKATTAPTASPTMVAVATASPTAAASAIAKASPTASPTALAQASPTNTPASVAQNNSQPQNGSTVAPAGTQTYIVASGDSLWKIAGSVCGDPYMWSSIAHQNKLAHPSVIHAGNQLTFTCTR